jgi:CMD domain protein
MTDLIDALLGITPDAPLAALRARREPARAHAEGAWRELVLPAVPGGLSLVERAALALRVALLEGSAVLATHYRGLLIDWPTVRVAAETFPAPDGEDRLALLLRYADLLARQAGRCEQAHIDALSAVGLSAQDIVAATQLIAFVPYQIRLLAGLTALRGAA